MKWNIITDSSCDIFSKVLENDDIHINSVPFVINVGDKEYIDDENLDTLGMLDAMDAYSQASFTACPSSQLWYEQFEKADYSFAITISSKLSGSINSALSAKEMLLEVYPDKKVALIDSRSASSELIMGVEKIVELIKQGKDFEDIVNGVNEYFNNVHIVFALSSFNNLVKNRRMSKIAGFVANKLGMWGIGVGSDEGTIEIKGKTRGTQATSTLILEEMKKHNFSNGKVIISHCHNLVFAQKFEAQIKEIWPNSEVKIVSTRGICSYYAERNGVIVSYY